MKNEGKESSDISEILKSLNEDMKLTQDTDSQTNLELFLFKKLFNSINDSVFIHDLQGKIILTNAAACRNLGYTEDELLSMSIRDIDTEKAAEKIPERIKILKKQKQLLFEGEHKRKDGSTFRSSFTPVYSESAIKILSLLFHAISPNAITSVLS